MNRASLKAFLLCFPMMVLFSASVWEGTAIVSGAGELPDVGYYISTNAFPRNTIVDIKNLENDKSVRAIVAGTLDSPGLLAIVSRDTASILEMSSRSPGRVRITMPTDPIAYSRFNEELQPTQSNAPTQNPSVSMVSPSPAPLMQELRPEPIVISPTPSPLPSTRPLPTAAPELSMQASPNPLDSVRNTPVETEAISSESTNLVLETTEEPPEIRETIVPRPRPPVVSTTNTNTEEETAIIEKPVENVIEIVIQENGNVPDYSVPLNPAILPEYNVADVRETRVAPETSMESNLETPVLTETIADNDAPVIEDTPSLVSDEVETIPELSEAPLSTPEPIIEKDLVVADESVSSEDSEISEVAEQAEQPDLVDIAVPKLPTDVYYPEENPEIALDEQTTEEETPETVQPEQATDITEGISPEEIPLYEFEETVETASIEIAPTEAINDTLLEAIAPELPETAETDTIETLPKPTDEIALLEIETPEASIIPEASESIDSTNTVSVLGNPISEDVPEETIVISEEPIEIAAEEITSDIPEMIELEPADLRPPEPITDDGIVPEYVTERPSAEPSLFSAELELPELVIVTEEQTTVTETAETELIVTAMDLTTIEENNIDIPSASATISAITNIEAIQDTTEKPTFPLLSSLEKGQFYLQLGTFSKTSSVQELLAKYGETFPISIEKTISQDTNMYRVMVGPLNQGESGALLLRFKNSGFKDAFVRKGM